MAPRAVKTPINDALATEMQKATGTTLDEPAVVATRIIAAIRRGNHEAYIGQPESFFVWLNGLLPSLVSLGLKKQTQIAAEYAAKR